MTPLYEPLCERCNDDGIERQATEERFGEPLCAEHAHAYDNREPPEPDLNSGGALEQINRAYDTYYAQRFK